MMMRDDILKYLKWALIAMVVIVVALLVFGFIFLMDWPWWVGVFLLFAIAGLVVGGIILRRLWLRRKEQQFVTQVVEQDESRMKAMQGKDKEDLKLLQKKWKEAIDTLRRSSLKKQGNPLYVLPWYMVIGESGSGKTTALSSARLPSPFAGAGRISGISGTRNCDWWFFDQAVIIDTAGRYTIPIDEGRDKEEWEKFLGLLSRYRRREPLNGLIVTVSADKLLNATPEELEDEGKGVRKRVDELMRVLGARFPVYALVTKCDLVPGMSKFSGELPESSLDQPMGHTNQALTNNAMDFMEEAFTVISERLKSHRLLLLNHPGASDTSPELLLFPDTFNDLKKGFSHFIRGAFQENPYQESPLLRGLFFSSGHQEEVAEEPAVEIPGVASRKEQPTSDKGLFLHDFFSKILPSDRTLFMPTKKAMEWRKVTMNLGMVSWIVFMTAICGFMTFSFVKNLMTLREIGREFTGPPALMGDFVTDTLNLDRFSQSIIALEESNRGWWLPRFGLNECVRLEQIFKEKLSKQFRSDFLAPYDERTAGSMSGLTASSPDHYYAQYIGHLVRRINLIKTRLNNTEPETLRQQRPPFMPFLLVTGADTVADIQQRFGRLYLHSLFWKSDADEIRKEMASLQKWLKHLLKIRGIDAPWVIAWANSQDSVPPVTLKDYWGGEAPSTGEPSVSPAYSAKGKEFIETFFREIDAALPEPMPLAEQKLEFEQYYRVHAFSAWREFINAFPQGANRLKTRDEWRSVAAKMAKEEGPYLALLNSLAADLEPLTGKDLPVWLEQVYQYQEVSRLSSVGMGALARFAGVMKKIGREYKQDEKSRVLAANALRDYRNSLVTISRTAPSGAEFHKLAAQAFREDTGTGSSPFTVGFSALGKLKSGMGMEGQENAGLWKLFAGPINFYWEYARMETGCYLQGLWEEKILPETSGLAGAQAVQVLFTQEGPAMKFVKEQATPFVQWRQDRGYYSKEAFGGAVPFQQQFLSFLNHGARLSALSKNNMNIQITSVPTEVNAGAKVRPHSTRLELQCNERAQVMSNFQYRAEKSFTWSSGCSDVTLQIDVGNVSFVKHYQGPQGFFSFMQDFKGGRRVFYAKDFPEESDAFGRLGIKYIQVNYHIKGAQEMLRTPGSTSGQVPTRIVQCWGK